MTRLYFIYNRQQCNRLHPFSAKSTQFGGRIGERSVRVTVFRNGFLDKFFVCLNFSERSLWLLGSCESDGPVPYSSMLCSDEQRQSLNRLGIVNGVAKSVHILGFVAGWTLCMDGRAFKSESIHLPNGERVD